MKLGMPTLIEYADLESSAELCSRLGLSFVELNMNLPICTPERLQPGELLELKQQYGIGFTIHLPEEVELASFQPAVRRGHLERCREAIDWASRAEIKLLNMHFHPGVYFSLPDERIWINERYEEEFAGMVVESFHELHGLASGKGIQLCIENTGNFQLPFVARSLEQILALPGIGLTWDVGHDAKAGFREDDFFRNHPDRIRHMHLHDFNGKKDHQPAFTGIVPVTDRLLFARERDLSVVVEVKTAAALQESVSRILEGDTVSIGQPAPDEWERILELIRSCVRDMNEQGNDQWSESYPNGEIIQQDIRRGTITAYRETGRIVGVMTADEMQPEQYEVIDWADLEGKPLILHRLAVDPAYQGKGIAGKLIRHAEAEAARLGYTSIRLDTYRKNDHAIRMYEARGYICKGEVYFPNRTECFYVFEKRIEDGKPFSK